MKHVLLIFVGLGIAVAVAFVLLRDDAVSPNGSLLTPTVSPTVGPSAAVSAMPTATPSANITVDSPKPGEVVTNRITVTGTARTFEQNVQWRLRDTAGKQLGSGFTTATAKEVGQFGPYTLHISVPDGAPKQLVIEVFESSAKDGSEINTVTVPVTLR